MNHVSHANLLSSQRVQARYDELVQTLKILHEFVVRLFTEKDALDS